MTDRKNRGTGKTALYCRVARANNFFDDAIKTQRDALRVFAGQRGFENCLEYFDEGYSGLTLNRTGFMRMDADIDSGKIDTVIVRSIDRVARDYPLRKKWIDGLAARGVTLITLDGSHESLPTMIDMDKNLLAHVL